MARKLIVKNGQAMADIDHGDGKAQAVFDRGDEAEEE